MFNTKNFNDSLSSDYSKAISQKKKDDNKTKTTWRVHLVHSFNVFLTRKILLEKNTFRRDENENSSLEWTSERGIVIAP